MDVVASDIADAKVARHILYKLTTNFNPFRVVKISMVLWDSMDRCKFFPSLDIGHY